MFLVFEYLGGEYSKAVTRLIACHDKIAPAMNDCRTEKYFIDHIAIGEKRSGDPSKIKYFWARNKIWSDGAFRPIGAGNDYSFE